MKEFALVSWLAWAGLTAALYVSPDEPLRAVESEEVSVTLRNFVGGRQKRNISVRRI